MVSNGPPGDNFKRQRYMLLQFKQGQRSFVYQLSYSKFSFGMQCMCIAQRIYRIYIYGSPYSSVYFKIPRIQNVPKRYSVTG